MEAPKENAHDVAVGRRIASIFVAWVVVAILTLPAALYDPWLFPAGLLPMVGASEDAIRHSWRLKAGWLIYLVLMVAACSVRRRRLYFILYGIFCLLLVVNIIGCHAIASGIH